MPVNRLHLLLSALLVVTPALAGCMGDAPSTDDKAAAAAGPDFGDAPDGNATGYAQPYAQSGAFPSLLASDGARVADTSPARLGPAATSESDASFPDADDGIVEMVIALTQLPPPATLTVKASAPSGSAGGAFFLNVLFDRDMDGEWGDGDWVVQNQAVTLAAGESKDVQTEPFALTDALTLPHGAWMRVALTDTKVAGSAWDGSGGFAAGEIEDHVVTFPEVDGKQPAMPVMTCPTKVDFGGAEKKAVTCTITNVAPAGHGDQISWTLTKLSGGVAIDSTSGVETIAPGAALPVVFTATKGEPLPSTWAFSAVGIDPPSRTTANGVDVGHGESEGEIEFGQTALACAILIAEIETSREHRAGESDAIFWVFVKQHGDDLIAKGMARVTGHMEDGTPVEATTDAEGRAEIRHTVYSYGDYSLEVDDVEAEGCEFDREASELSATASVQPG